MRKFLTILLFYTLPMLLCAQRTPVEKYDLAPASYQNVFLDHVEYFPSKIITTNSGQYVGQVDFNNRLYGYGMFINNDGSQIVGMFRNGKLFFGISMSRENAMVGSPEYYANYGMETGRLDYVLRSDSKQVVDGEGLYDYAFVSMRYQNGDQYVGEIYQRKRHGYGIYYYANGDIWFGQYNNDVRYGFGALFDVDNQITLGWWEGEDIRRIISVEKKKK